MNANRTSLSINRRLVALFAAVMLIGSSPAYGQNGAVGIAYPAKGITIDGDLGDWPKGLQDVSHRTHRIRRQARRQGRPEGPLSHRLQRGRTRPLCRRRGARTIPSSSTGPGKPAWNAQDGCELFIDAAHAGSGSPVIQYARYGNQNRIVGPPEASEKTMKVAVARTDSRIVYEWRIEVGAELDPDRAIGFDVSVADKDKDGSFSWAAWGSGTQKTRHRPTGAGSSCSSAPKRDSARSPATSPGKTRPRSALPSRVRIQSSRSAALWRGAIVDPSGAYKATTLPVGPLHDPRRGFGGPPRRGEAAASTSGSRPTGRRKPTSSASRPSPGPG